MKRQIKSLNGIVGLTVDSVAVGDANWRDGDCIAVSFTSGAFIIIEARRNWSEGADAMVDTEVPRPSEFLVATGVFTLEEYESYKATEKRELEQLARLRAKYR